MGKEQQGALANEMRGEGPGPSTFISGLNFLANAKNTDVLFCVFLLKKGFYKKTKKRILKVSLKNKNFTKK